MKGWVSETVVGTQWWRCDCAAPPWCVQDLVASTPFLPEVPPCPTKGLHPADLDLCTLWNTEKVWRDKEEKRGKGKKPSFFLGPQVHWVSTSLILAGEHSLLATQQSLWAYNP